MNILIGRVMKGIEDFFKKKVLSVSMVITSVSL